MERRVIIPVNNDRREFCDYMGYEFLKTVNGYHYYYIPPGHVCRFTINYERWKEGIFDREKFLKKLEA